MYSTFHVENNESHLKAAIVSIPSFMKTSVSAHFELFRHGSTRGENLFGMSILIRESPLEDKKYPQFLTSRLRVTDLFLQDVNHNKQTGCTRLYKVRKGGLWELEQRGAREQ